MELRTTFPKSVRRLEAEILDYRTSKEHCWSMWLRKLVEKAIIDDSNKHSLEIEMPMTMNSPKGHLRKCEKEARQRLDKAWDYLSKSVEDKKAPDLEEKNMIVASQILVPEARRDPHTQYRAENVIIDNATYAPPPPNFDPMLPDKHEYRPVPAQIATMINELGHLEGDFHKAIYSHFHIARIHPFADGNGRLARLVQNAYLKRGNLLPIVIPSSERELYSSILDAGVQRFYEDSNDNERSSRYIHPFSEYLVSKMEHSFKLFKEKKVF